MCFPKDVDTRRAEISALLIFDVVNLGKNKTLQANYPIT